MPPKKTKGQINAMKRFALNKTALVFLLGVSTLGMGGCASIDSVRGANANDADVADLETEREYEVRRHVYAGIGGGSSWMQPDTSEVDGVDVNDRYEAAGQVTLGMDVTRHFSIEAHSADLGSAGLSPTGRINYHVHGASALLYAGKNRGNFKRQGLLGYGRLGLGVLDNSPVGDAADYIQDNGAHVLFGLGLEYMTRYGLGLRAEAIAFEEDARYMQLGLVYRMGKRSAEKPVEIVEAPAPVPVETPIPVPAVVVAKPAPVVDQCEEFSGTLEGVNFHTNSSQLTDEAQGILDNVASRLAQCDAVPVRISAHTDSSGKLEYNQGLSERRADSVATYLGGRGIDQDRLQTEAFGETMPIETNDTSEGRRQNRRVELITIK